MVLTPLLTRNGMVVLSVRGAYVKTMPCSCCNNWITGEYIELNDGIVICDRCYKVKNIDDAV